MKSKISDLGVFAMGFGVLFAALTLYLRFMLADSRNGASSRPLFVVLAPVAVLFVSGLLTYTLRNAATIVFTMIAVTLLFAGDALLSLHPIKLVVAAGCIGLVVSTGFQALKEVRSSSSPAETESESPA